jgi:nicotinamidase-related amidase
MLLQMSECQLVLVDYQMRLMPAIKDASLITANALALTEMARLLQIPVFVTEQTPAKLGETVPELRSALQRAHAQWIKKMHFSAVEEGLLESLFPAPKPPAGNARSLPKHLQKNNTVAVDRSHVVLAGCEAHICLLQTALDLLEEEVVVWVVTDACGSRTDRNRDAAFDRLASNGAELVTTEMVAFEWLRTAEHPSFKAFQALIK